MKYYTDEEARQAVIEAGLRLLDEKLTARTWGNISARVSEDEFIITPSGIAYPDLKPQSLVKVRVSDLFWEGDMKPSSEKGVHASCYALRPDCMFVIHTHQCYATAISVDGRDKDFAPCAKYGLPGTDKLRKAVEKVIKNNPWKDSFLMTAHGAVILGTSSEDAFDKANELEKQSKAWHDANRIEVSDRRKTRAFCDDYAQILGPKCNPIPGEDAQAVALITEKNALCACSSKHAKPMGFIDVRLQNHVYRTRYSKLMEKGK